MLNIANIKKRFKMMIILNDNFIFLLLFASAAVMGLLPTAADGFGFDSANSCSPNGGGKVSRRGRAQMLATIPCDLTQQAYCQLPGAAYPWHAVRRFVHENQGLMKRMYGDVRHIAVLRDEFQNNEIDIEDVANAAERYSRDGNRQRAAKLMRGRDDFSNSGEPGLHMHAPHFRPVSTTTTRTRTRTTTTTTTTTTPTTPTADAADATTTTTTTTSTSANMDPAKRVKPPNAAGAFEGTAVVSPHDDANLESNSVYELLPSTAGGDNIRIIDSPRLGLNNLTLVLMSAVPTISTTLKVVATTDGEPQAVPTATTTTSTTANAPVRRLQPYNRQRPSLHKHQQQQQQLLQLKAGTTILKESSSTKLKLNESEGSQPAKTTMPPLSASPTAATAATAAPSPSSSLLSPATAAAATTTTTAATTTTTTTTAATATAVKGSVTGTTSLKTATNDSNNNKKHNKNNQAATEPATSPATAPATTSTAGAEAGATSSTPLKLNADLLSGERLRKPPTPPPPPPTAIPAIAATPAGAGAAATATATASNKPVLRDGQLYQDTLKLETSAPPPVANLRGINACPVKEEVVAPFWANNTRGEVLALLNLYPFEQYVHWEKCTHEHKQMYCRDGCRCEQQYRLHRLLAYDPHNECRGIFSDWFRFPSCCICKCYNIPMDFRATSRSPRADQSGLHDAGAAARHPIDVAEDEVKRAIYEHATEEWYRPRDDEFDFGDE